MYVHVRACVLVFKGVDARVFFCAKVKFMAQTWYCE